MENDGARVKAACAARRDRTSAAPMTARTEKEKRLADALRQNLRRRKEQAREQDAAPDPEAGTRD